MKKALVFAVLLASQVWAAGPLAVDALLKDAAKFDGKTVKAVGVVEAFQAKTSKRGNKYTVFRLKGAKDFANVYFRNHLKAPLKNGQKVEVAGVFRREKKLPTFTVKNEIDASVEGGKAPAIKVLK